jgi:NADPH:quinone reductase-like Zn-dependent oxidoreductase
VDKKMAFFKNIELSLVPQSLIVLMEDLSLVKIPDWLSFEEASTLPCAGVTV